MKEARNQFSRVGLAYLAGSLLIYGVQFLTAAGLQAWAPRVTDEYNLYFLAVMLPMYAVSMPLMGLVIKRIPGQEIKKREMTAGQLGICFLMCYGLMFAGNLFGNLVTMIIGFAKGSGVGNPIVEVLSDLNPWLGFFVTVLLAPVAEELLFRKLLADRTVRYGEGCAVLLSGLMFGLFHGNFNQFAYAFLIGVFFAYIYVKTGNVKYTIILHMALNFMGSTLSLLMMRLTGYDEFMAMASQEGGIAEAKNMVMMTYTNPGVLLFGSYSTMLMFLAGAGIILLLLNRRKFVCLPGVSGLSRAKKTGCILANTGMILYILFWGAMMVWQLMQ